MTGLEAAGRRARTRGRSGARRGLVPLLLVGVLASCERLKEFLPEEEDLRIPAPSEIAAYYQFGGDLAVGMSGNVAQITVVIDQDQYRLGGEVWVKASPYIFLFSPGTRDAFTDHPGLGGVRVIVNDEDGAFVAEALLERSTLNGLTWDDALFVAGRARAQGTQSPGYMRDLVRWGEDHTTFRYSPDYVTSGS